MSPSSPLPEAAPTTEQATLRWFAEEVQPHEPALKSWLHGRFPWLLDVDDVAQLALIRLWRRWQAKGAPIKSAKATLFAIARNAAVDLARRRAIIKLAPLAEIERMPSAHAGADIVETVNARQELEFLAEALRQLPQRGRQVMTLTKLYGMTEREVARELGISEHTVRTHVVRGMERCSEYLLQRGVDRSRR